MTNHGYTPRIVALGMQGLTALAIAQRVGCSEEHAYSVLRAWKEQGGDEIMREYLSARAQAVAA